MTNHRSSRPSQISKFLQRFGVIIALLLALWLTPAMAQSIKQASVVLDGRPIFQVSSSEQFSAQKRADWINSQLQAVVKSQQPPDAG